MFGDNLISLSACSIQGKRHHMEDYFAIGYQLKSCDQRKPQDWPYEYFYFGIFDGHGGTEAAKFAKKNLLKCITDEKDFWSDDDDDIKRAIRNGFAKCHSEMKKEMPLWYRNNKLLPSTAGTTASILFIRNGKFYTGHVGDTRIVIAKESTHCGHWIADLITEDHKPELESETQRIVRAGGEVRDKIGVHRVVWKKPVLDKEVEENLINCLEESNQNDCLGGIVGTYPINETIVQSYQAVPFLAIARSLGDFWSINPYSGQYIVSPEPDVDCRPIMKSDKCIVLATDGLWNVFTSSQVIRLIHELQLSSEGEDPDYCMYHNFYDVPGTGEDHYAHSLVCYAYQVWERRRLKSDNITAVVAVLHDLFQYAVKPSKPYKTRATFQPTKKFDSDDGPVQLGQTDSFLGKIRLDKEPKFRLSASNFFREKWDLISDYLVLPPTIYEKYSYLLPKVIYPKNYLRLSAAKSRKIPLSDSEPDSYILIKHVTDDQADKRQTLSRTNARGKEVRDASCQATQPIHDFGQPWDELPDEERIRSDDGWGSYKYEYGGDDPSIGVDWDLDEVADITEVDLYEPYSPELAASPELPTKPLVVKKEDKAISQLRCLLNCTPPLRRSARKANISMSESNKRKIENASTMGKYKRRKSQPSRLELTKV